ncbi:MAG: DNA-binding protein [Nitrospirae bacterium]|nr:DNA-binding protein [Nitrospirota bacterium]
MKRLWMLSVIALTLTLIMGESYAGSHKSEGMGGLSLSGKVIETMNSGGYTYVLLETHGEKIWVAVPQLKMKIVKGRSMSFQSGAEMINYESKTLKRKFDRIIFSPGVADRQTIQKEGKSSGSSVGIVTSAKKIKVGKAAGQNAYTIAEIYKNKSNLDKKNVIVSGKVVKVSMGIMKRNWIHLQDGSGNPQKGDHNLVVTSQDLPSVGDVVIAGGILHNDRDFGAGYIYAVIIEDAEISKK